MARTSKNTVKATTTDAAEQAAEQAAAPVENTRPARKEIKPRELKPTDYITVKNGFPGKLIYISKRNNEQYVWSAFGDEQDIELQELKNARNSSKAFFENNWFLFDDPAVVSYLGVERMYANSLNAGEFGDLFKKTPDEIEEILAKLPDAQKLSLAYLARQKIADHEIDSLRVIELLEKYLNVPLIER